MLTKEQKQEIIFALEKIKLGRIPRADMGICGNVKRLVKTTQPEFNYEVLYPYFRSWPEFSGINMLPVKGDYIVFNVWQGEYGETRLRLVDFMIALLTKEVSNEP